MRFDSPWYEDESVRRNFYTGIKSSTIQIIDVGCAKYAAKRASWGASFWQEFLGGKLGIRAAKSDDRADFEEIRFLHSRYPTTTPTIRLATVAGQHRNN